MRYATAYLHNTITGRIHAAYFRELPHDRWRSQGYHTTGADDPFQARMHMSDLRERFAGAADLGLIKWDGEIPLTIRAAEIDALAQEAC
jgi:hypothetical protein